MVEQPSRPHALDVVVVREHEALIWHGLPKSGESVEPQRVPARDPHRDHRHVHTGQAHHMHHPDGDDPVFFDAIAREVTDAERILVIGHGHGRSNVSHGFVDRARTHHREIAERVIGEMRANLPALEDHQLIDLARHWYAGYVKST